MASAPGKAICVRQYTRVASAWAGMLAMSLGVCLQPLGVQAQTAEPHGFIEPCTVGNVQEMDTDCELCTLSPEEPEACHDRWATHGYVKKCRTRGTRSGWGEVWCKQRSQPAKPGATQGQDATLIATLLLLGASTVVGLVLFLKRKRRASGTS